MKKYLIITACVVSSYFAQALTSTISGVSAGKLSSAVSGMLSAGGYTTANLTGLTITGTIDASDFYYIRTSLGALTTLDISGVTIAAYTGMGGTGVCIEGCTGLTYAANTVPTYAFTVPNITTGIPAGTILTSVVLPSTATAIDIYAFWNCTALTSVTIPSSITSIGGGDFEGCTGLPSISIPSSVTTIGGNTFSGCTALTAIYAQRTSAINIASTVFTSVPTNSCFLYVPSSALSAYKTASVWKNFSTIVPIYTLSTSSDIIVNDTLPATGGTVKFAYSGTTPNVNAIGSATTASTPFSGTTLETITETITNTATTVKLVDAGYLEVAGSPMVSLLTLTVYEAGCTPVVSLSPTATSICAGSSVTLSASGDSTYKWSNSATTAAITVSPSATTTYTVTGTVTGCTSTAQATVTVNALPTVTATVSLDTICAGVSTVLTASGGSLYNWSNGATTAGITVTPTTSTIYYVTGTNSNGCSGTFDIYVKVNALPTITATVSLDTICAGVSTVLTASGGSLYNWSNGATTAGITVTPTTTTMYYVTGTNSNGCSGTYDVYVKVNALPTITATASPSSINSGSGSVLTASGGSSYNWSNGIATATQTVSPTASTIYVVTGTTGGCSNTAGTEVVVNLPTISSFSPISGTIGTTVTISGTNFNVTLAKNIVFFGATMATVTSASTTSLTVTVPAGATYQTISVTNLTTGLTSYATQPFITTFLCGGVVGSSSFATKVDSTTGTSPHSISIGDIDGDGKPDLAVANSGSNTVSVFLNTSTQGSISFAKKIDFITGTSPQSVSIGDVDGDGKPDLAVANYSTSTVSILRNTSTKGTVSFANKVDFTTGSGPYSVSIGDVDNDGKPDLAVTNYSSNTVSVLRNMSTQGSISFATKVDFTTGTTPCSVSISDIDGDGKPDLAVANAGSNTVSVFLNTSTRGTVSFATKTDFTTGSGPQSVSIGDVDGDGKPDLAVANYSSNTVSVLRNTSTQGTVSFATKTDFTTGTAPFSVSIGDVDGDGKPDLAVANYTPNTVSILKNTSTQGTVSFATKTDFTTGTYPRSVSISDIDGDGKPDLAVANHNSNTVSVLRNVIMGVLPTITASAAPDTICSGASTVLTAGGGSSYSWSNGATTAGITVTPTTSTMYYVTGTNSYGCSSTYDVHIKVNALPTITIKASPDTIISGANAMLTASGANTYSWNNAVTTASQTVSPVTNTTYTVTGTDANACTNTASIGVVLYTVSVSSNSVAIANSAISTATDAVTSNATWTASSNQSWLTVSPNTATTGSATLTFITTTDNPNIITRSATVTIQVAGTTLQTITVTQAAGNPTLSVSANTASIAKTAGSTASVSVTSNSTWSVSSDQTWLTLSPSSATTGNATLTFTAASTNPTIATRTANVTISAPGATSQTIVVTQAAGDATLSVSPQSFSLSKGASSNTSVTVTSNTAWTASSNQTWLTLNASSGSGNGTLTFTVTNNSSTANRTASVTVSASGASSQTVTITQAACVISTSTITASSCESYTLNSTSYTSTGVYSQTLQNKAGCDSVITLNLTINHPTTATIIETACGSYTLNGTVYKTTGVYNQTLTNKAGCDSLVTLILTVNTPTASTITQTACSSYALNDSTYTKSGVYTQIVKNKAGCDSTITLNLTIHTPSSKMITATACGSYTLNKQIYNATGTYYQTVQNAVGCDSTIILNLTINPLSYDTIVASACEKYQFMGKTLTASGRYNDTLINKLGCDSIVTLKLTIFNKPTITITPSASAVCIGASATLVASGANSYVWNNTASGSTIPVVPTQTTNYSVTATDVNSCVNTASVTIAVNPLPTVNWSASNDTLVCSNGTVIKLSVTVSSTGGTGVFATLQGLTKTSETVASFDPTASTTGTKTLGYTYTDVNGCSASAQSSLQVFNTPQPAVVSMSVLSSPIPTDSAITFNIASTYSNITWYEQPVSSTAIGSGNTFTPTIGAAYPSIPEVTTKDSLVTGTYYYNYTQTINGCESQPAKAMITVTNCPALAPLAGVNPKPCTVPAMATTLTASPADTLGILTWFDGSDILTANQLDSATTSYTVTATKPGAYVYYAAEYDTVHACYGAPTAVSLTINPLPVVKITANDTSMCKGMNTKLIAEGAASYKWGNSATGNSITVTPAKTGSYAVTGTDVNGCVNTDSISIAVKLPSATTVDTSVCGSYTWNSIQYTKTGTYTQTLNNAVGCDSIVTLQLTINLPSSNTITKSACSSYTLNGTSYSASGTYKQTIPNKLGCDSTITLHLTILKPSTVTYSATAVGSYTFNNTILKTSGTYTDTLQAVNGCDSIVVLNLTILKSQIPVSQIVIPKTIGMIRGDTATLSVEVLPTNASDKRLIYSSLDSTIVSVDSLGHIIAVADGITYISVISRNSSVSSLCAITVTDSIIPLQTFTIPSSVTMVVGQSESITAKFTPVNATNQELSWSSQNTSKVTVDNSGVVHAIASGKVTLVAIYISDTNVITKTVVVTVLPSYPPVLLPLPVINMSTGQASAFLNIAPFVSDDNTPDSLLKWSFTANNTNIAMVNDTTLKLTPKTAGAVYSDTITVTVKDINNQPTSGKLVFNVMLAPNTPPKVLPIDTITIQSAAGVLSESLLPFATDDYTLPQDLVWSLKKVANHANVVVTGNVLIVSSSTNGWAGLDSIMVSVTDGGGLSTDKKVIINLSSAPNQPPVIAAVPPQYQTATSPFATINLNDYVKDDYTPAADILWVFSQSTKLSISEVNGIATATILDVNWVGAEVITFTAVDQDGAMISRNVLFVQEAPVGSSWMTKPYSNFTTQDTIVGIGQQVEFDASILGANTWKWIIDGANPATSGALNPVVTYSQPGTYSVSLIAQNSKGIDTLLEQNVITVFGLVNHDTTVCKGSNLTISVNLLHLDNYTWSNGMKTATIIASITSDTLFAVAAQQGLNTLYDTIRVKINKPVTLGNDTSLCAGTSMLLKPGTFKSYKWQDGSTASTFTTNPKVAKTYSVTVTDGNGCISSSKKAITAIKPLPVTGLATKGVFCEGSNLMLVAANGIAYLWSDEFKTQTSIDSTFTASKAGVYYVSVTGANGCSTTDTTTITINSLPTVSITTSKSSLCLGDSLLLSGEGATTYMWGNGINANSYIKANVVGNTIFTVTGTDGNGCSNTATTTVVVNNLPKPSLGTDTAICKGSAMILNPGKYTAYQWQDGSSTPTYKVDSQNPNQYSVTVTDANGCVSSSSVAVTAIKPLPVAGVPKTGTLCQGSTMLLVATGGISYYWNDEFNTQTSTNDSLTVAAAGLYYVSVTGPNGCSTTDTTTITVNQLPTVTIQASKSTACLGDSVMLNASGAASYTWSNGTHIKLNVLGNNAYSVTGTDANGCSNSGTTTVVVNDVPQLAIPSKQVAVCNGQSATLTATGAPTITWNNSVVNGQAFTPAQTGTYVATGTNSSGCSDTINISVVVNPLPTVTATASKSTVCRFGAVTLQGTGAKTYTWSNAVTDNVSFKADTTTTYTVTGTDATGCQSIATVSVNVLRPYNEQLGLVTYDSATAKKVIISWNRHAHERTERYVLLRLNNTTNLWDSIAGMPFNHNALYIDTTADLDVQAFSYRLATIDSTCHNKDTSILHRTVHLQTSLSTEGTNWVNLDWTSYQGLTFPSYSIIRYSVDGTDSIIGSVPCDAANLTFTDKHSFAGAKYRMAFTLPETIQPDSLLKSDTGPFSQSLSNMAESQLTKVTNTVADEAITLYPNPAGSYFSINIKENALVQVYTVSGTLVMSKYISERETIATSGLPAGLYVVKIMMTTGVVTRSLVVE